MAENPVDPEDKKVPMTANAIRANVSPATVISIDPHKRGVTSRGGENSLVRREGDQPALTIEDGIYMADGKPISKAEFMRLKGGGGD